MIAISIDSLRATLTEKQELICDNAGYGISFSFDASWAEAEKKAHLLFHGTHSDSELIITISSDQTTIPAFSNAYALEISVADSAGDRQTNKVWLDITGSIKSFDTSTIERFDVYNETMLFLKTWSDDVYDAIVDHHDNPPTPEFPSDAYKQAVTARNRYSTISGEITLANEDVIQIDDADIAENSLRIVSSITTNGDFLLPGGVPAAELAVTLKTDLADANLYRAKISLTVHQMLVPGVFEDIPLGEFTVYQVGADSETGRPITAYDAMKKLDDIPLSALPITEKKKYSPNQIISMIAQKAGIPYSGNVDFDEDIVNTNTNSNVVAALGVPEAFGWGVAIADADGITDIQAELDRLYPGQLTYKGDVQYTDELPTAPEMFDAYKVGYNGYTFTLSELSSEVETARDLLMHTASAICAIAYVDRWGSLRIKPLQADSSARTYTTSNATRSVISSLPYRIYSLGTQFEYYDDEDIKRVHNWTGKTLWLNGVNAELPSNPLFTTIRGAMETGAYDMTIRCLQAILGRLDLVAYTPLTAEIYDDPALSIAEWVTVKGTTSPITTSEYRYHNTQSLIACGSEAVAGILRTQAEKAAAAERQESVAYTNNIMRDIYMTFLHTYEGLENFKYQEIEHYTYAEIEGE